MQNLILVCGRPGSGKSTLAKVLAKEFHITLLDKDCVDEAFSPDDRGPHYDKEIRPRVYQALMNLAELNLRLCHHVILDAPWTHNFLNTPQLKEKIVSLVQMTASQLVVFDIELPKEDLRTRLTSRGYKRDADKLTREGWDEFLTRHRIGEKSPLPHIIINGRESPDTCAKKAIAHLRPLFHQEPL